jgi:3-isopropylmalate/(R)-2-methylmalate dehydratase large subunit
MNEVSTHDGATGETREAFRLRGRVLFLAEDLDLVRRQLGGEDVPWSPELGLINNISTDEITPGWACFHYDETLARFVYVGLRGGAVAQDAIKGGGFDVIVSGISKGCGSSRETAPCAEKWAGVRLVIARSIEKIYGQNCENIGLLTSTDPGLVERLLRGEAIAFSEFTRGRDPISRAIIESGGLFEYNKRRLARALAPPAVDTPARAMTLVEKIVARAAVTDARGGSGGVAATQPGDALFIRTDVRFSHEYVTPMAASLFMQALGKDARVVEPESVFAFRDHLTFLGQVMPPEKRRMGLLAKADGLAVSQEEFCAAQGIRLYGEVPEGGSEAICHNAVLEDLALPGQVVCGTDSHTCTAGAVGCLAIGVGATDMANAWYTRDVRVRVPETVRFVLHGRPRPGVVAKDVMLYVMAQPYIKQGRAIGQVLEFAGPGLAHLNMDERATLTNMSVEAGAFTGIIAPDAVTFDYLAAQRGLDRDAVEALALYGDPDARYAQVFDVDLGAIDPMVATPGDPRNGVPLHAMDGAVKVDIAYGGSCTGGKMTDMDMYARVLGAAEARGLRVHPEVQFFIQFGSQQIRAYAERMGYIALFERVGARLVNPSCGACIAAGPGVSIRPDQVTISAINRNFPGRSGPGKVYLASPLVVAASAVSGQITAPEAVIGG